MIPTTSDEPDFWHEELKPLLMELDLALQNATPKAHKVFSDHLQKPVNRPLLSNLIRYFTLEYLKSANYEASDLEDDDAWALRNLSNNGIEIVYRGSRIRIRKGVDPPCPSTGASRDFYQLVLFEDLEKGQVEINILVLWNLSKELLYESEMYLIKPSKGNRKYVKWSWRISVVLGAPIDLAGPVEPEYMHSSELPVDPNEVDESDKEDPKTGTTDVD